MKVLVLALLYPNAFQKNIGLFIKERMTRVAHRCDLRVLAPIATFPFAGRFSRHYGLKTAPVEMLDDVVVYHPGYYKIPRIARPIDGLALFLSMIPVIKKIRNEFDFDLIDAHFAYPEGVAAELLGKYFKKPVTITLRGTISRLSAYSVVRRQIRFALENADGIISVSRQLAGVGQSVCRKPINVTVIPNGVDPGKFHRISRETARKSLGIEMGRKVIVSVGGLVERKGHHRIVEALPALKKRYPDILFLVVGGGGLEGDFSLKIQAMVSSLGLSDNVRLAGEVPHADVHRYLCAADIFALATRYEGWANVFFEAMACGLPVVATDVGGNAEVVNSGDLGTVVPFGDRQALEKALLDGLERSWDAERIVRYANARTWEDVASEVHEKFKAVTGLNG